ncbi:hypothetical protein K469DRAFT_730026 [Zopfia rhizophila CBS 207.26]|uniref:Integral membrane protein-like protein n=1 Tax=Zopfia rhizophila CBS 207.26 TaxID=1314779 RepID=A0A6A6EP20_9PEZI|nr:hypothetical protein K469DRAFT_730026 [Zopfia rhizophila CBS 207.26]
MPLPPIVSSCLYALGIGCVSNIIAQKLKAYSNDVPFVFDQKLFLQFAFVAVITTPVNYCWQNWLERTFPGWKMVKQKRKASSDDTEKAVFIQDDGENKRAIEEEVRVRDWWNIFKKWFTDCITIGALFNTFLFLVLMGMMEIGDDLRNEMWQIIWDSYKMWPIANFFSTTYCPVERRIVFFSFCGLLWNVYLTLVTARL